MRRRVLALPRPPLTADELKLLRDNAGCFKCRQYLRNHTSTTCTNDFPNPKGYKTLTSADVEAARTKKRAKPIAAVIEDEPVAKRAREFIEEIIEPVAVVMPSAVLGDGSESGDECVAFISVPHFQWPCLLDGPNTEFSLPVDALINAAFVKKLGLCTRSLKDPVSMTQSIVNLE